MAHICTSLCYNCIICFLEQSCISMHDISQGRFPIRVHQQHKHQHPTTTNSCVNRPGMLVHDAAIKTYIFMHCTTRHHHAWWKKMFKFISFRSVQQSHRLTNLLLSASMIDLPGCVGNAPNICACCYLLTDHQGTAVFYTNTVFKYWRHGCLYPWMMDSTSGTD